LFRLRLSHRGTVIRHGVVFCLALAVVSCGGIAPAPRYASPEKRAGQSVVADLKERKRAFRQADRSKLRAVIDTYLGVPYQWGGTTRAGMDCSALARAVYRETYGIELPRTSREMYKLGRPIRQPASLKAGDLVFFKIATSGNGISHVGVYLGDGRFAHASSSRGGVIDDLSASYFETRYAGGRRILPR
jgi:lipoprotein Spr